jgi:hypothetical protein
MSPETYELIDEERGSGGYFHSLIETEFFLYIFLRGFPRLDLERGISITPRLADEGYRILGTIDECHIQSTTSFVMERRHAQFFSDNTLHTIT